MRALLTRLRTAASRALCRHYETSHLDPTFSFVVRTCIRCGRVRRERRNGARTP